MQTDGCAGFPHDKKLSLVGSDQRSAVSLEVSLSKMLSSLWRPTCYVRGLFPSPLEPVGAPKTMWRHLLHIVFTAPTSSGGKGEGQLTRHGQVR